MNTNRNLFRGIVFLAAGCLFLTAAIAEGKDRVVVTYYHGTLRCHTCLEIERLSQKTLEERFAERLRSGELQWRTIDYDRPENSSAVGHYNLTCPSLVISREIDGRETAWRVAGKTWKEIEVSPEALMDYVEEEVGEARFGPAPGTI